MLLGLEWPLLKREAFAAWFKHRLTLMVRFVALRLVRLVAVLIAITIVSFFFVRATMGG